MPCSSRRARPAARCSRTRRPRSPSSSTNRSKRASARSGCSTPRATRSSRATCSGPKAAGDDGVGVELPDDLADGTYTATYRVVSADSHPVTGGLVFTVGKGGGVSGKTISELIAESDSGPGHRGRLLVRPLDRFPRDRPGGRLARFPRSALDAAHGGRPQGRTRTARRRHRPAPATDPRDRGGRRFPRDPVRDPVPGGDRCRDRLLVGPQAGCLPRGGRHEVRHGHGPPAALLGLPDPAGAARNRPHGARSPPLRADDPVLARHRRVPRDLPGTGRARLDPGTRSGSCSRPTPSTSRRWRSGPAGWRR